jgi:hypothetical protein
LALKFRRDRITDELDVAWRLAFELKLVNGEIVAVDEFGMGREPREDAREILAVLAPTFVKLMPTPEPFALYVDIAGRFEMRGRWQ